MMLARIAPAPPLPPPGSSVENWILLAIALALVVLCGAVIASRR